MSYKTLTAKKGDTFISRLNFFSKANGTTTPLNIANKVLKFGIFNKVLDANNEAVLLKSFDVPDNTETQAGIYNLVLTSIEMNIDAKEYYCEFSIIDVDVVQSTEIFKMSVIQDLIKN
ncbi:MAG: hypothetical protein QG564_1828 [Campylobacterota bacterium]|nr:hypothetical protein [Campylobacterota bacterium]